MDENKQEPDLGCSCGYAHVTDPKRWDIPKGKAISEPSQMNFLVAPAATEKGEKSVTIAIDKTPSLGRRLRINVVSRTGFTEAETKRHQSAMTLLEIVVNSLEFKKRMLVQKFTTTKLTSQQVYDKLMTGEEDLRPGVDYELDIEVVMYSEKSNVVGYTQPNVTWTKLNRYVTANYSEADIAGNCIHEALHKLGFDHASAKDYNSVPYFTGYLVSDMVEEYQKGARFTDLYPLTTTTPVVIVPATPETPAVEVPVKLPTPTPEPKYVCTRSWKTLWTVKTCYWVK